MKLNPHPGSRSLRYCGDRLHVTLEVPDAPVGRCFLRTNLARAHVRRREIIEKVETGKPRLDHDWHDLEMFDDASGVYSITLPLLDVGYFEGKAYFLAEGSEAPSWPVGDNFSIKVEASASFQGNGIYSAFVRQFGPSSEGREVTDERAAAISCLELAGYAVIPRSGTFRDLLGKLDVIINELGFRNLLLLPIHATPTVYARMGRFGSPFATLDFLDYSGWLMVEALGSADPVAAREDNTWRNTFDSEEQLAVEAMDFIRAALREQR